MKILSRRCNSQLMYCRLKRAFSHASINLTFKTAPISQNSKNFSVDKTQAAHSRNSRAFKIWVKRFLQYESQQKMRKLGSHSCKNKLMRRIIWAKRSRAKQQNAFIITSAVSSAMHCTIVQVQDEPMHNF